jgi:hypothetical protein
LTFFLLPASADKGFFFAASQQSRLAKPGLCPFFLQSKKKKDAKKKSVGYGLPLFFFEKNEAALAKKCQKRAEKRQKISINCIEK